MKALSRLQWTGFAALALAFGLAGCTGSGDATPAPTNGTSDKTGSTTASLSGSVNIDGSSTVFPVTQAAAEDFTKGNSGVNIKVGQAGTGAGMKKFLAKEIDICDASRPIEDKEIAQAKAANLDFIEVPIAYDGLSVVVNKKNTFVKSFTTAQLKKIWAPGSTVKMWSDVDPTWPKKPISLYGPTTAHGSFEYWTEAIVEKKKEQRADYQQCNDYNALVAGVAADENALGYVGFAYVKQNSDKLTAIPVDSGKGPVAPDEKTIVDGSYSPLSRPLMIYVTKDAAARPEVKAFVEFLLADPGQKDIAQAGYIPFSAEMLASVKKRFEDGVTGSVLVSFKPGMKLSDILK